MGKKKVIIAHVPYQYRGGEDSFVAALFQAYEAIGFQPVYYPAHRHPPENQFKYALQSLSSGVHNEFKDFYKATGAGLVHLNNAYPQLGPSFFRFCINARVPLVMTVHNHRFYCTNGLALREGRICKDCFEDRAKRKFSLKPFLRNCNGDMKKTGYYSLAMSQLNRQDLLLRAVRKFICPSPYIARELIRWGADKKRVEHVLNPVQWNPDPMTGKKLKTADVFYAGRLSHEKGIRLLLDLIIRAPEMKFVIAGDGPERKKVIALSETCNNFTYYPQLTHDEVLAQIQKSRVGVLLSTCNEILPTFVLECFAYGKRCLVPDLDSTDWFDENKGEWFGVLTDVHDADATLERLRKTVARAALADDKLTDRIEKIREKISSLTFVHSLDKMVREATSDYAASY